MEREKWLEERKKGIGGSDAAAVLGLSKWKSSYEVWLDKTNQGVPIEDNEAMMWGRLLEPVIRQEYANRTGLSVKIPSMLSMPEHPHILANLDGVCEDRVVEIKTSRTAKEWGEEGTNQVPVNYYLQTQHYMLVTGLPLADIAVLIGSSDFRIYQVEANHGLFGIMLEQYADFWRCVENKTPPETKTYADAMAEYRISNGLSVEASLEIRKILDALKSVKKTIEEYKSQEETLKGAIMNFMRHSETLTVNGMTAVSWKSSKSSELFDSKSFKVHHPDLYTEYTKPSVSSRRFLIK